MRTLGRAGATNRPADEISLGGVTAAGLGVGIQTHEAEKTLSTSDDGGTTIPTWASYAIIDADARFIVAYGAATSATVGHVYGAGTWVLPLNLTTAGTGKVHLAAVTGSVSAFLSWGSE